MSAARSWGYRHPHGVTGIRITAGAWNLILGIILIAHGYQWGAALFAVAALIFWAAFTLTPAKAAARHNEHS